MARLWPLLVVLAAIGAILFVVLGENDDGLLDDAADHAEEDDYVPPELRGHGRTPAGSEAGTRGVEAPPAESETPAPADAAALLVVGRVLDAATDEPLAGAEVRVVPASTPCPRLPIRQDAAEGGVPRPVLGTVVADAEGRFRVERREPGFPAVATVDLFATRAGYVLGVACGVRVAEEVTLRLEKGLTLEGRIVAPDGVPVEKASVRARPGPETPVLPGHGTPFDAPSTDEEGAFTIDGLLPGALLLDVEHPHYMPRTAGPYEPEEGMQREIVLVPALRATFRIRTDDGRDPEHPTLVWRTTGANPRSEVLLLAPASNFVEPGRAESAAPTGELTTRPVRLPCDAPSVVLQIKADGYATWTSEPLRLPSEGGEETYEIALTGDVATGSVRIAFEDDAGEKVVAAQAGLVVEVALLSPGEPSSAYVLEQREDLRITDLPAGGYRIRVLSTLFAPVEADLTVDVGQEAQARLRVRPPAKVHVRFTADDAAMVRFRLVQGGEVVHGVPEGSFSRGEDEATGEPILTAGSDGLLLSGLASGTYTIEVLSEEHMAPPTVVHLVEGDTTETEIHVRRR